ncbi:MAG TPA: tetratricopeptide repeat protein [Thermoanaerobaculia bacterium]|nr:tetratricopeptide repeat protein [Thermoanaerobaculia bacterium]
MGRKARLKAERAAALPAVVATAPQLTPVAHGRRLTAAIAVALVILVAIVFAQLRDHEFLTYDDPMYVTENEQVQQGLTAGSIAWAFRSFDFNWHPLTWLTHMADVELFGLDAGAHLLVNAAIHALNTILLLLVLARATGLLWRSAVVAALFAIHPLHVESVAWLSERKDVLSSFFLLLTIWFYLRFVERRSKLDYAVMVVVFILGLMSKGMLVTLPFVLLLLDYWPLRRFDLGQWRALRALFMEKLLLFVLIIPAAFVTWYAQHVVEAIANVRFVSFPIRLANAAISYLIYIRRMFWPDDLALGYSYPSTIRPSTAIASAIVLLLITLVVIVFRERRYLFTGWFWFAGMLVPVSGIVQIGPQSMADRYTYIPLVGLFIALVWLVADFVARRPLLRIPAVAIAAGIVFGLTFAARTQASHWKNTETLFRRTAQVTPRNPVAHESLGLALFRSGDYEGSIREFTSLTQIRPNYARGYAGLGAALLATGRTGEATEAYRTAVLLDPADAEAQRQLGNLEIAAGRTEEAQRSLEKAAALGDTDARGSLAIARGDTDAAIAEFQGQVAQNPRSPESLNNLAAALARKGQDEEALEHYRAALRIAPFHYDANMNIGALLSRLGKTSDAITHFVNATRARPEATEPHIYLGLILAAAGHRQDAIRELQLALQINPQTANTEFTNALRIPPKPTNLQEYLAELETGD